jgi:DNA-binding transcriptional MerR regulator
VSELLDIPVHVLRQWEAKIPQLRPRRGRNNRRYYLERDIEIARRIKQLIRHERMSMEGARIQIAREMRGEGRPRTRKEALELVRQIEEEIERLLDLFEDQGTNGNAQADEDSDE